MKKTPTLDGADYISACSEYFRISKAAELLKCTPEDLLHLGVNCKVQILAPVLSEGIYEWAIEPEDAGFPEIIGSVKQYFDAAERVLLSWTDLAKIEAIGWAIPIFFYAPSKAQEIDEMLQNCLPESLDGYEPNNAITISRNEGGKLISSVTYSPMKLLKPDSELFPRRKQHYFRAWYPEMTSVEDIEKTTISNLFISKKELERLKIAQPNDAANKLERGQILKVPHGNTERFASQRETVLVAAIYCKNEWPDICNKAPEWANKIELEAKRFWPDSQVPPLERESVVKLLNAAIKGNVLSNN